MPTSVNARPKHPYRGFRNGLLAGMVFTGAAAATLWLTRRSRSPTTGEIPNAPTFDDPIDETGVESFPASDPPAHAATLGAKTPA